MHSIAHGSYTYTVQNNYAEKLISLLYICSELDTSADIPVLQPLVDVSDRGNQPNSDTCEVLIQLYNFEDTVTTKILISVGVFDANTFEQVIGGIINIDIDVTNTNQVNNTFYEVDFFGRDGSTLILADDLAERLFSLNMDEDQKALLARAGIALIEIMSNSQTVTTPTPDPEAVPVRPIPAWAVAVIVVMNSVIIIGVLMIVLGITWRRYKR